MKLSKSILGALLVTATGTNAQVQNQDTTIYIDSVRVTVNKEDIIKTPVDRMTLRVFSENISYGPAGEPRRICSFCGMG
jgi:hypothetical protein